VASLMMDMKCNVEGKGIYAEHFSSLVKGLVEKCMIWFRIHSRTIKLGNLLVAMVL